MNPVIMEIAKKVGVRIENRACDLGHIFDGSSIATHFYSIKNACKIHPDWAFATSCPDCIKEVRDESKPPTFLSDHDLLHEVMHFAACNPEQKDLPEFGLGDASFFNQTICPEVVDFKEGANQEYVVQLLCCYFGSKNEICPLLSDSPDWEGAENWETYFTAKKEMSLFSPLHFERAIKIIQQIEG